MKESLLAKVSRSEVKKEEGSQTVILDSSLPVKKLKDYAAVVFSQRLEGNSGANEIPVIHHVQGTESLSDGDVIEIFPDGRINVLYQIKSRHNLIFVTSKCDCHCIMCPQPVDENEESLTDLNLKLIPLISKETQELALTGGEPTLAGEDLFRLILVCKDFLSKTSLLLLTNGRKFSDFGYTRLFSSLRHPDITIGIPLYGDNDLEHDAVMGSKGAFNETVMGIINLASFGNQIEIRTVVHNLTYNKLLRISDFIYRNMTFVRHIAFMGLEVIDRARKNVGLLWVEPDKFVPYLEESIHYLIQRGMKVSIYNIPLCLLPDYLWGFAQKSISDWKNLFDTKCIECSVKEKCSGMFDSGIDIYGKYLKPIR
ncbi:MAG: His-Xaa-Ser system radical SAM maturase HxsC [bacterium]|nr:His-Xaa-Ser system radical SAM maturase HxsC [bacterium]